MNMDDESKYWSMAKTFEGYVRVYKNKPFLKVFKDTLSPSSKRTLKKACEIAESLKIDYDTYVRAQFWWFDKCFSIAPKLHQLASGGKTCTPKVRAEQYLEHIEKFSVANKGQIVSKAVPAPKQDKSVKHEMCEANLNRMMQTYNKTEAEIYAAFNGKSLELFFDGEWLAQRPVYVAMKAAKII